MTALNVLADTGRVPGGAQDAGPRRAPPEAAPDGVAAALLEHLEQLIDAELGPLRAGVEPLLSEVRQGLAALYPGPGGVRLAPKEQQAQRARLGHTLDGLEDVLEALQLAARSGMGTAPGVR